MENPSSKKPHLCVIAAGDVASGKSSLLRCLADNNKLNKEEEKSAPHKTCHYSAFETAKRLYTLIDPPSSRKYFDQMYSSACSADLGILVVAAGDDSLKLSFRKTAPNPQGHAAAQVGLDHLLTFYTLSTTRLVVAVSKLDFFPEDEQEARFTEIQKHVDKMFTQFGQSAREHALIFIPISSMTGENVHYRSATMDWWQGVSLDEANAKLSRVSKTARGGNVVYTLIDVLDNILLPQLYAPPCTDGPLSATILQQRRLGKEPGVLLYVKITCGRIAVGDVITVIDSMRRAKTLGPDRKLYKIRGYADSRRYGRETVPVRLEEQFANQYNRDGMECRGTKYLARIISIRLCNQPCEVAEAGNAIYGLRVELVNASTLTSTRAPKLEERLFHRGRLLVGLNSPWRPAARCRHFTAHCVLHYVENVIRAGFVSLAMVNGQYAPVAITKLNWNLNLRSVKDRSHYQNNINAPGKIYDPPYLNRGEFAEVQFAISEHHPLMVKKYDRWSPCHIYGRIVFLHSNQVVMIGRVVDVIHDTDPLFIYWAISQVLAQMEIVPDVARYILRTYGFLECGNEMPLFQRHLQRLEGRHHYEYLGSGVDRKKLRHKNNM